MNGTTMYFRGGAAVSAAASQLGSGPLCVAFTRRVSPEVLLYLSPVEAKQVKRMDGCV